MTFMWITLGKESSCNEYAFVGDWYDNDATTTRKFLIHFFPLDGTLDMYDMKNKRTFLRRTHVPGITLHDFYIGGSIRVFGRLIYIVDFGCESTRKVLSKSIERTFAMIKPISNEKIGEVIQSILDKGYRIVKMKMTVLSQESAIQACHSLRSDQNLQSILDDVTSGPVIGIELVGDNAVNRWCQDMGHANPDEAENGSLRKQFGTNSIKNALYGPTTLEDALQDLSYFFPVGRMKSLGPALTAVLNNSTCCIIKPHAIREGNLGRIIKAITNENYKVTAIKMCYLENTYAAEFYEVYKGVVPDYMGMVGELTSGPCVAMEIVGPPKVNTPVEFRKLVGPIDPEIARKLRPHTLRAKFGQTRIKNAVHCSDLPEDGLLEVEYFFKILD